MGVVIPAEVAKVSTLVKEDGPGEKMACVADGLGMDGNCGTREGECEVVKYASAAAFSRVRECRCRAKLRNGERTSAGSLCWRDLKWPAKMRRRVPSYSAWSILVRMEVSPDGRRMAAYLMKGAPKRNDDA